MDDLHEIDAIQRLKHRYLRCLDQKLWDELGTCFAEDATCAYGDGKYSYQGRAAILDFLRTAMGAPSFLSSHRVHHPEIELTARRPPRASGPSTTSSSRPARRSRSAARPSTTTST
jgi:hypothetical protein